MSATPGPWPKEFPVGDDGRVEEGLVVRSLSGEIEGRTTGSRFPCRSTQCDGWLVGVKWETGQQMYICNKGWEHDPKTKSVRVTGGGEISARVVSPEPLGTPPLPTSEWPDKATLAKGKGWRKG